MPDANEQILAELIKQKEKLEQIKQLEEIEAITLDIALREFGNIEISEFAKITGVEYQTLRGWREKVSNQGKVTLYYILKCKKMKSKVTIYDDLKDIIKQIEAN